MGKQRHKRGTVGAVAPPPAPTAPFWRVTALPTLAALTLVAGVWFYLHPAGEPKVPPRQPAAKKARPPWVPTTADDRLVDAFRTARNADAKSTLNLAPDPVFDGKPVGEAEWEALQAHYILRRVRRVDEIRPGEPGKDTTWLDTPGRYTLRTRAGVSTPKVPIKQGDHVEAPSHLLMTDPDLVVEVRGGELHAVRAESRRD